MSGPHPAPHLDVAIAGPATSVQDGGRRGHKRQGLGQAGAMDRLALALANALVGQGPEAAAVEVGPLPARFVARGGPVRVALAGAARGAAVGALEGGRFEPREALAPHATTLLREGEALDLGPARGGVFSVLAVEGGLAAPPVLGSLSVLARAGLGSPYPRPLRAGDRLALARAAGEGPEREVEAPRPETGPVRVVLGPQDDHFAPEAIALFLGAEWRVGAASDRMGYRLEGPAIAAARGHNIVSDGVAEGAVQVPGDGQPLVLLADRGTTGGYPKIAVVVSADVGRLAQVPAGGSLRFAAIDLPAAQALARARAALIAGLPGRVTSRRAPPSHEALIGANLAGRAVSALDPAAWTP